MYNTRGTALLCKLACVPAGVKIKSAVVARCSQYVNRCAPLAKCGKVAAPLPPTMSTKLSADDVTLAASFATLGNFGDIARLLEVKPSTLSYYLHSKGNYKQFELTKRSGGKRLIHTPATPIKIIQRKLNQVLHSVYTGRSPAHGFIRGKSIITNAARHLDREFILNFDLQDFFPSIHFGRVLGMFEAKPYLLPKHVAVTLTQICSHNGTVPIGAPTSPVISNMICAQMDSQLKKLAIDSGCTYTRYADDITFSKARGRPPAHIARWDPDSSKWVIGDAIEAIIHRNGFKINPTKTRLLPRGYRQEVTGLVVNDRVNVKRTFVRHVRAILHACEKWGVARAETEFHAKFARKQTLNKKVSLLRVLRGKIEFIGAVRGRDDYLYLSLLERYLAIDPKAHTRRILIGPNASDDVLEKAVWILEDTRVQGSAFAADKMGLLTAAHVLTTETKGSCPPLSTYNANIDEKRRDDHVDVALCQPHANIPIQFRIAPVLNLKKGDPVRVLGFPLHRAGNALNFQQGKITSFSPWHGVPHAIVDCSIVRGNSGGPVLNSNNEVIGIAVKGQGTPKKFSNDDELSRFVPIDFALKGLGL